MAHTQSPTEAGDVESLAHSLVGNNKCDVASGVARTTSRAEDDAEARVVECGEVGKIEQQVGACVVGN